MENKPKVSEPIVPEPRRCPRCGTIVLLGDPSCPNCKYNMETFSQRLKAQPPMVVTILLIALGMMVSAVGLSLEDNLIRGLVLGGGALLVISGGMYYAFDLFVINADDRRKK